MENRPAAPEAPPKPPAARPRSSVLFVALMFAGLLFLFWALSSDTPRSTISYGFFRQQLNAEPTNISEVRISGQEIYGKFKTPPYAPLAPEDKPSDAGAETASAPDPDGKSPAESGQAEPPKKREKLHESFVAVLSPLVGDELDRELRERLKENYRADKVGDGAGLFMIFSFGLTILVIVVMFVMLRRVREQFLGGGILSGFSKSPAKRYETSKKRTTFADVAGLEGVKHDLSEVVEFLKNPEKFQRLGGRIPKGTLLMGPPGTGKTLLAKAVAGEAGVPFFSISGSEFIQMFVGVGASRVRDMFKTAKEAAPCILFIDEIDAVGRIRGAGLGGGHDEREQTLNQILSEMDGFSPNESVIVLAATNRPDVLDPALLRPGRFDRHITVDRPNLKGREAIFKVHAREVLLANDVDLHRLASGTVGLTGADIRNLVNEAALWATRQGKDRVEMIDFEVARDKILMGPKREEVLTGKEKLMTAYHEAGHALLAWLVPGAERLHKVTIIPRGRALGVTQLLPEEDRMNIAETELHARLAFMLGGRAAEKLVYHEYSAGAEDDLKRSTQLARRMVTHWGMSDRLGPVAYRTSDEHPFLGKEIHEQREFSEHTAQLIDEEVARILHEAADRASGVLERNRAKLDVVANALAEREILDDSEIQLLIGPSADRIHANGHLPTTAAGPLASPAVPLAG